MDDLYRGCNHQIFNQPETLEPYNSFLTDPLLKAYIHKYGMDFSEPEDHKALEEYGALAGNELIEHGRLANENQPTLKAFDRYGRRIDQVEFHPSYHALMSKACEFGLHNLPWKSEQKGAHLMRAILFYLHNQADAGTACPVTMTFASFGVVAGEGHLDAVWREKLLTNHYDPRALHAEHKEGIMLGMAMTEKQGGTDVRENTSKATHMEDAPSTWLINGHKWFCSAPMSDGFLTLAQTEEGLSCFLVPKWLPDDSPNGIFIQRLKNKLGNHSNASSEIEYGDCVGYLLGAPGKGIRTIMQMVGLTRYDCALGSAALMRQAMVQAYHHTLHRSVMGKLLINQPLMRNVLADLALESNAATLLAFRLARCLDAGTEEEMALFRIGTAIAKYWVCKQAPAFINEAAECMGGAGYVEEFIMPRLYREAPVNSTWEGSGNVQCLDLLRAIVKEPDSLKALQNELSGILGENAHYDKEIAHINNLLASNPEDLPYIARSITASLAQCWQAKLIHEFHTDTIFEDFCRNRLTHKQARNYGHLDTNTNIDAILNSVLV